jgi:uncharacterized protein
MFRKMRRSKQLLSMEDTLAVMDRGKHGILSCLGDEEYPYGVAINYVYFNDKIYLHSAKSGHKIDAITKHPKVSFLVIDEDTVVSPEFTTYFRSAIAFGKARIVEGEEERIEAFWALSKKYSGDQTDERIQKEIDTQGKLCHIIAIEIDHLTGKEAIELVRAKRSV